MVADGVNAMKPDIWMSRLAKYPGYLCGKPTRCCYYGRGDICVDRFYIKPSRLLPHGEKSAEDLSVELYMGVGGDGRGQSQSNAAEGVVGRRRVSRRIFVPGTPRTTPIEAVQAPLQRDPI